MGKGGVGKCREGKCGVRKGSERERSCVEWQIRDIVSLQHSIVRVGVKVRVKYSISRSSKKQGT